MNMMTAALSYADRGWHVFPVHSIKDGRCDCNRVCRNPGKHPITEQGLHNASTDPDQITAWWSRYPDANIGVRTGRVSDLWVLDVDAKRSVDIGNGMLVGEGEITLKSIEDQAGESLPDTLINQTGGGGMHLLFSYPRDAERMGNRVNVLPSVDVRGDDGFIVVPPSIHASGRRYTWADEGEIVANPPDWLLSMQSPNGNESFKEMEAVEEGSRNDYIFRYAARLRGEGRGADELSALVMGTNIIVCKPPLPRGEVLRIIKNVMENYEPNPPESDFVFDETGGAIPELDEGAITALSFREMMANPPEPREGIIHGGMLDKGDGFILAGVSGVGKSWCAMDMGLSIATGGLWLGEYETTPSRVLYLDEEAGYTSVHERISMLSKGVGLSHDNDIPFFLSTPKMMKLDDPKGFATVARLIDTYRADVVIMDTMVRFHTGNENSNEEMAAFFDRASRLRSAYGCTLIFIHHIKKPTKDDPGDLADQMRGASDIRGWPDGILMLRRDGDGGGITMVANHAKSRNHREIPEFKIGVDIDNEKGTARVVSKGDHFIEAMGTEDRREQIKKVILGMTGKMYPSADAIAGQIHLTSETVQNHLNVMEAAGEVTRFETKRGETDWYALSSEEVWRQKGMM